MQIETLGPFETVFIFVLGLFTFLTGTAVLLGRDASSGKRDPLTGLGVMALGAFFLLWSTRVLQRLDPKQALVLSAVCGGLFVLTVLRGLRGMPRELPGLREMERIPESEDLREELGPPAKSQDATAVGRVGLVLEGGGAKGAYAFGCIKALTEAGIRFDAVAGSSVGALNAALLGAGMVDFGEAYWGAMRHRKVYRPRLRGILLMPIIVLRALLYVFSKATGIRDPSIGRALGPIATGAILFFAGTTLFWGIGRLTGWTGAPNFSTALTALIVPFLMLVMLAIRSTTDALGISLLLPNALRQQVESIASRIGSSTVPVYATLCERVPLIDPDHVTSYVETTGPQRPLPEIALLPVYVKLNDLQQRERVAAIMASAAMPIGIFPPVKVGERRYSDGGEIDNVPVYPLFSLFACDTVVVVRLNSTAAASPLSQYVSYVLHWGVCDRTVRLRSLPEWQAINLVDEAYGGDLEHRRTINIPPTLFPCREPPFRPRSIITVAPRKDLGGFFTGTLNFSASKAVALIEQGLADARGVVEKIKAASSETSTCGSAASEACGASPVPRARPTD